MTATTTSTKGMGLATLLVIAAIAGIASATLQKGPSGRDPEPQPKPSGNEDTIVLSSTFEPTPRGVDGVHITVMVEGKTVHEDLVAVSPWSLTLTAPKGAQVSMNAYQEAKHAHLECMIHVNGEQVAWNYRDDPGSVRCWHNRR